jgi:hypothetical protein
MPGAARRTSVLKRRRCANVLLNVVIVRSSDRIATFAGVLLLRSAHCLLARLLIWQNLDHKCALIILRMMKPGW